MPKQTTDQKYQNTATYSQIQPESNKYIDAYATYRPEVDPSIGYRAGEAKRRLNASFQNPLGGYATPLMRDKLLREGNREIDQSAGQETRVGQFDVNQLRQGQLGSLAALMQPRVVQSSSSGTSSGSQGQNLFGNLLDLGMGAASIF